MHKAGGVTSKVPETITFLEILLGNGSGSRQYCHKCRPMLDLRWQKYFCCKVFYAWYLISQLTSLSVIFTSMSVISER